MKKLTIIIIYIMVSIILLSCEKRICCAPPPEGPVPTIEIIVLNEDSSSLKNNPQYNSDSIYLFQYSVGEIFKESGGFKSTNLKLDTSGHHITLSHPGNYGAINPKPIYFKTLEDDIDTIIIYNQSNNSRDFIINYNNELFAYDGDSTKSFYVFKSLP